MIISPKTHQTSYMERAVLTAALNSFIRTQKIGQKRVKPGGKIHESYGYKIAMAQDLLKKFEA